MLDQKVSLKIIDSHTEGEPTRVVVDSPFQIKGTAVEKRDTLRNQYDWLRTACLNEPRGYDAIVGAFLSDSDEPDCIASVVFFNNVGYLNGCIHGTLGVAQTLIHMGRIGVGSHGIETPVGRVVAHVDEQGSISVCNVPSYRYAADIEVNVPGYGRLSGDIAWGGNWFFLAKNESGAPINVRNAQKLTEFSLAVRKALQDQGITGADDGEIDHVEIFGQPTDPKTSDSRNFVLCPGGVYDRSPCGTGTSAKMACLYDAGQLAAGDIWRQAGILDTIFFGSVQPLPDHDVPGDNSNVVAPTVSGRAFVNAEMNMILDPDDPFRFGICD